MEQQYTLQLSAKQADTALSSIGFRDNLFRIEPDYTMSGENENIIVYCFNFDSTTPLKHSMLNKTIKIRTYAFDDMSIQIYDWGRNEERYIKLNSSANIELDPASGICEYELFIDFDGDVSIPYWKNDLIEFTAHEKKESVWKELDTMNRGGYLIASGTDDSTGIQWRKWHTGAAELWASISLRQLTFNSDNYGYLEVAAPIDMNCYHPQFSVGANGSDVANIQVQYVGCYNGYLCIYVKNLDDGPIPEYDFTTIHIYAHTD